MLVLSRRVKERLLIPCVRTAIQVLAASPGSVRLGINAPSSVAVLREELAPSAALDPASEARSSLIDRLNNLSLGLALASRHVRAGKAEEVLAVLDGLGREFQALCEQLACAPERAGGLEQPLVAGPS